MGNKQYNKYILEAVTQGKVGGQPARSLDPFHLAKTTLLFILLSLNGNAQELNDYIIYTTNNIVEISNNCQLGFCQKKVVEAKDGVVWMVLPECNEGKAELSNQKYK
jgi:hypothetical protein